MERKTETRGRVLGLLLALALPLAMAACLLPGMAQKAYADGTHTHDGITFVEWTDELAQQQWGSGRTAANSLPKQADNYYLTKDVTLTDRWNTPSGTTNLCLGGKTITGKLSESAKHDSSVVNIEWDSTLNLYDDEEGAGKIVSEEYEYTEEGSNLTVLVRVVDTFDGAFNMYGGTLCATEGNQVYSGVYVNGGAFNMYGGTIRGARASGVDVGSRDGVFTMNGGTITGNKAPKGGGVFVQEDGTFTMTGGNITGNEAFATEAKDEDGFPMYKGGQGGGVYVEVGGTFTMAGGSITSNDAQRHGGGVYNKGAFSISGAPEISGNIHTHAPGYHDADNVYLERGKFVNVAGELTNAKPIGITMQGEDVFTSGEASGYITQFASDSDEFVVAVKGKELMLQHLKHGMSYDASGATVTAECAWPESCSLPDGKVALTIKAPTLATYGGAGNASATLEGLADFNKACGLNLKAADIKYYKATKSGSTYTKDGSALSAAPTGAGDYLAEMPVPTAGEGSYVYANVGYTIAKADISKAKVMLARTSYVYDGKAKEPAVTVTLGGRTLKPGVDYAVSYKDNVKAGTATAAVAGKGNYAGSAAAKFTIKKEAPAPAAKKSIAKANVALAKTKYTYDGKAKRPKVKSVVLGGKKLKAGTDYSVKYANNRKVGKATVTVAGKGSYKDSAKATFSIVPGKAKLKTVASSKAKAMKLQWAKVPGAKSYQVQWRERGGKWKTKAVKSAKATGAVVKGMKPGKLYDFRVRAQAGKSKGAWSAQSHRWFVKQAGVVAKSTKSGTVKVTWDKTAKASAGYLVVVRYAKAGKVVAKQKAAAGKTSATVRGLEPGKKAWVQVRALRKAGSMTYSGLLTGSSRSSVKVAGKSAKALAAAERAIGDVPNVS